jgi:hypothetical protein
LHRRLASSGDHLNARAIAKRSSPTSSYGGDNEAIKSKELEAQRQVTLTVSPAEATTSAVGSLTSGGDHLITDDSGHLRTGSLPATVAASARAKRSSLPSSHGSEDKTIQECGRHPPRRTTSCTTPGRCQSSAAGGVEDTVDVADLHTARLSPVRWTDSHTPTKR